MNEASELGRALVNKRWEKTTKEERQAHTQKMRDAKKKKQKTKRTKLKTYLLIYTVILYIKFPSLLDLYSVTI